MLKINNKQGEELMTLEDNGKMHIKNEKLKKQFEEAKEEQANEEDKGEEEICSSDE